MKFTDNCKDEIIYFLDPINEFDVMKITFNNAGEIMPIHSTGWYFDQASYTIKNLDLNCKILKEARKEIWIKCSLLVNQTQKLIEFFRSPAASNGSRGPATAGYDQKSHRPRNACR